MPIDNCASAKIFPAFEAILAAGGPQVQEMSSHKNGSSVDDNYSDLSDHNDTNGHHGFKAPATTNQGSQPMATPRIKLKLQLNPPKPPADLAETSDLKKKKKHKHREHKSHKHHKKHKKKHNDDEDHIGHRRNSEQLDVEFEPSALSRKRSFSTAQPYEYDERESKRPLYSEDDNTENGTHIRQSKPHKEVIVRSSEEPSGANMTIDHPSAFDDSRRGSVASSQSVSTVAASESAIKSSKSKKKTKQQRVWIPAKRDLKTICSRLLDTFVKRDAYGFFLEPVDTTLVLDYLKVIKQPMDLSTMRKKLENNEYPDMDAFKKDFQLICSNAKIYNAPDTLYWKNADKLEGYGVRAIDREAERVNYDTPIEVAPTPPALDRRKSTITIRHPQSNAPVPFIAKRDSVVKIEEDVDILGLDNTTSYGHQMPSISRKGSIRQGSAGFRESSMDVGSSRAITPNRTFATAPKKKKKKISEAGVIFGPDGSLSAVHGVPDLSTLVPRDKPFATLPPFSTINRAVLPSTFYTNRSMALTDDMNQDKYHIRPAFIWDYGAYPSLGVSLPSQFYTAQDLAQVYPVYGDDRGETYMKSMWDFVAGMFDQTPEDESARDRSVETLCGYVNDKLQKLTRGAWTAVQRTMDPEAEIDETSSTVETEFGNIDVPQAIKQARLAVQRQKEPEELLKLSAGKVDISELENLEPKAKADELPQGSSISECLEQNAKLIAELLESNTDDDTKKCVLQKQLIQLSMALPMTEAKPLDLSNDNTASTTSTT
ncbi:hypothetical protein NQZ79_g5409 [Umbelopsis isabellina]|nr:hypothetical protein NQZ79_g5409 [Umbelopsis isabellina]